MSNFKLSLWNWTVIFCKGLFGDGLTSVFEYIATLFNEKVLSKVKPEDLVKYSGIVVALAEFGEKVLNLYIMDVAKRAALTKTVDALRALSIALSDGKVTADELEETVENVVETIKAWRSINTIEVAPAIEEDSVASAELLEQVELKE